MRTTVTEWQNQQLEKSIQIAQANTANAQRDARDELVKAFNVKRKANKGKWIQFDGDIWGGPVAIKSYDTWIQVATFNGIRDGGPTDCTVKAMNEWLTRFLKV